MSPKAQNIPRKPPVIFTPERKLKFLEHYRESGLFYVAADLCGVTSRTVDQHRKDDVEFGEQVDEAKQFWVDTKLVAAAIKRGVEGFAEPIFGGQFKDEHVGDKMVYSDSLLQLLMKARRAEFRTSEIGGAGGGSFAGVLIVPTAPMTMDQWEANHGQDALGETGKEKT